MVEHFRANWHIYFGMIGAGLIFFFRLRGTDRNEPMRRRFIYAMRPDADPKSPEYDRGKMGRIIVIFLIGAVVVTLANLLALLLP